MRLTYAKRSRMRASSFALPKERKYPIPDVTHGRAALARVSQHGTRKEQAQVKKAVYRRFPCLKP